jgi:hypothetical protein
MHWKSPAPCAADLPIAQIAGDGWHACFIPLPLKTDQILGIRLRQLMARIETEGFLEAPDNYYRVK